MTINYKILGQSSSQENLNVVLYTVPDLKQAIISNLFICNIGNSTTVKVAIVPSGSSVQNQNYVIYNLNVDQYDTIPSLAGVTLDTGDQLIVIAATSEVSFSLFGSELS